MGWLVVDLLASRKRLSDFRSTFSSTTCDNRKALIIDNNELSLLIGTLCLAGLNYENTPVLAGLVHPKGAKAKESPFLTGRELSHI
ncbi:unnamed protein product [Acidithrix sp. C25]|nr:unnamed protein product [Acidithrix sp. C25]